MKFLNIMVAFRQAGDDEGSRRLVALTAPRLTKYNSSTIIITFPDHAAKCRALGFLSGRFAFKSWASGEMIVPEDALAQLTLERIPFAVADRGVSRAGAPTTTPLEPRDQWERGLLEGARPWGVSFSDADLSSEGIYD